MLLSDVQSYIKKHELLNNSNSSVIVGVSGGVDSIALLHILKALGYNCIVAHCNFHLRMDESDRDCEFVRAIAESWKFPFYSIDFQTEEYAVNHKISIEMAARELRYQWFDDLRIECKAQAVAVAHHADDNIETMLMNLVRGTGLRGLSGMPVRNQFVIRPLLDCTREELNEYLVENKIEHVEDSSNKHSVYTRNKFRNQLLPLLQAINPSVKRTLHDNLQRFNATEQFVEHAIETLRKDMVDVSDSDSVMICIPKLATHPHAHFVLFELLQPYRFSASVVHQIFTNLHGVSGKIFYSPTHRLLKDRDFLLITARKLADSADILIEADATEVFLPQRLGIRIFTKNPNYQLSTNSHCVHLDADKVEFPLRVRTWKEGDSFFPLGMNQRKKVSDFMIDKKFSLLQKESLRIVESHGDIVWLISYRPDNRFKVTDSTQRILELSFL